VHIVSDDSDPDTLTAINSGVISGTVVQMPYEQGYTGAYILAAEKVLGKDAAMSIIKPYLASDGSTLSSGVGLITKDDISQYNSLASSLGIS
jgi:ribose transport system substrate-binding protein